MRSRNNEYDREIPKPHTADQPTHRAEEPPNTNNHKTPEVTQQALSSPSRRFSKVLHNNRTSTMGVTINDESTTIEAPP